MLFSSIYFLFYFLPIVLAIYYVVPEKYKNYVLLVASFVFYSWGEPVYVFLMIYSAVFNYTFALEIARGKAKNSKKQEKINLVFAIVINLLTLGFFKYYGFVLDSINLITGLSIKYTPLPLPIGISFYTFQAMSYVIDVYRGDAKVQKNLFKFALYLSLFPQLIAGPIVKYKDVAQQLDNREATIYMRGEGANRFILGLAKKVILANNLGALHTYIIGLPHGQASMLGYWIGILAYTFQIYFDFSGYSDMAIGLGKMFGFTFMENFNYPYISKSITEFWRRWHISLSTWFKEYLYIPLGGNRVSVKRHILNLLIVWSLTGLWHGAAWNFVAWGLYYGILLILEKYLLKDRIKDWKPWVQHLYAMLIVMIGWVFFSCPDFTSAMKFLGSMFFMGGIPIANKTFLFTFKENFILLAAAGFLSTPEPYRIFTKIGKKHTIFYVAVLAVIFLISVASLVFSSYNPFLYFRF